MLYCGREIDNYFTHQGKERIGGHACRDPRKAFSHLRAHARGRPPRTPGASCEKLGPKIDGDSFDRERWHRKNHLRHQNQQKNSSLACLQEENSEDPNTSSGMCIQAFKGDRR